MLKVEHPNYQPTGVRQRNRRRKLHQESRSRRSKVKTRIIRSAPGGRHRALGVGLGKIYTWWLIPLSKWVITPVING